MAFLPFPPPATTITTLGPVGLLPSLGYINFRQTDQTRQLEDGNPPRHQEADCRGAELDVDGDGQRGLEGLEEGALFSDGYCEARWRQKLSKVERDGLDSIRSAESYQMGE